MTSLGALTRAWVHSPMDAAIIFCVVKESWPKYDRSLFLRAYFTYSYESMNKLEHGKDASIGLRRPLNLDTFFAFFW